MAISAFKITSLRGRRPRCRVALLLAMTDSNASAALPHGLPRFALHEPPRKSTKKPAVIAIAASLSLLAMTARQSMLAYPWYSWIAASLSRHGPVGLAAKG